MVRSPRLRWLLGCLVLAGSAALGCGGGSADDPSSPDASTTSSATTGSTSSGTGSTSDDEPSSSLTFDHRHTALDDVPASCIEALKSGDFVVHYGHRSHGAQLVVGAESLEAKEATYGFDAAWCSVPEEAGVLKMWDGMTDDNLVRGEDYWASQAGVQELRGILSAHPEIRYTMWAWSFEISEQTEQQVDLYLETLSALEQEFPEVTFIYMTGTAQESYGGANRAERNRQIRTYCEAHGKVLYDFEDLDSWWNGERHTTTVDSVEIPMEHPRYSVETPGNTDYEWTHTTQESCENKARAFWWMMASLEGCSPATRGD